MTKREELSREEMLSIATRAVQWHQALEAEDTSRYEEIAAWVKTSSVHARELLLAEALDAAAANVDPQRLIDIDALPSEDGKVVPLREGIQTEGSHPTPDADEWRRRSYRWKTFAAGMGAAGAVALIWWLVAADMWRVKQYATTVGEQHTVRLEDGSILQLNTQSQVEVRFSRPTREVRLIGGEVFFKVAHDLKRPFLVYVDDAVVRAVGTQFDVYKRKSAATVSILEGQVEIARSAGAPAALGSGEPPRRPPDKGIGSTAPLKLAAGEAAEIEQDGGMRRTKVDVSEAAAWRQRQLVFRESPLADIAGEFNRYNTSTKIIVVGDRLRAKRYGGTFDADDPFSFADLVAREGEVIVEKDAARIVIRER